MSTRLNLPFLALFALAGQAASAAEPGSGILVDHEKQVWFTDAGGIWRLTGGGELTQQSKQAAQTLGYDINGRYAQAKPERYQRITGKGVSPAVLASTTGPIAMGPEGDVYYAASNESGPLHILRLSPNGESFVVAKFPDNGKGEKLRRVNGMAVGPDGAIYVAGNHTIRKVTREGAVTSIVGPLDSIPDCIKVTGLKKSWRPYMRGITVDGAGNIYVAAAACSTVLRVTADGKVATVLQSDAGWTPTGVATYEQDLYVLEYQNAGSPNKKLWVPRIRKLTPEGKATTLTARAAK
jgi:hypothetical protein